MFTKTKYGYIETVARVSLKEITNEDYFEVTYKHSKGHYKIGMQYLLLYMPYTDFKKVALMISTSDDAQTLAGYLNSIIRKLYDKINTLNDIDGYAEALKFLEKRSGLLVKYCNISPLKEKKEAIPEVGSIVEKIVNDTITSHELMTELKRCNVHKLVPTQVKPIWENCKIDLRIGYSFEYRGFKFNIITDKGWVTNDYQCKITIIDPVIGLPVTSYDGTISELEDKLSQVFMPYLQTLESNKETIVQIAHAFKELKKKALIVA